MSQIADSRRRVALDQRQIRRLAHLHGACPRVLANKPRRHDGRCSERFRRAESGLHVNLELVYDLDARAIGPRHDRDARLVHAAEDVQHLRPARAVVRAREIPGDGEASGPETSLSSRRHRADERRVRRR